MLTHSAFAVSNLTFQRKVCMPVPEKLMFTCTVDLCFDYSSTIRLIVLMSSSLYKSMGEESIL